MSRRDCLRETIAEHLTNAVKAVITPRQDRDILPVGTAWPDLIDDALVEAEREDRLEALCYSLKAVNPSDQFHNALDHCLGLDNPAETGRPRWYDEKLPLKKPLIDRDDLRKGLYAMLEEDPGNTRLMTVRGEAPGKTYCRCLIQHVASELGREPPVIIDLLEIESVQRLAERLVDELGLSYAQLKERFSTEIREGRYFNDWFAGQSRSFASDKQWLIVFDHLAKPAIPQDVAHTVLDLAVRAMDRRLKNIWIILLDCPLSEALESDNLPIEEEVQPIPRETITEFVDWLVELRRAAGDADPRVPDPVADIIQQPFPLQKRQLDTLKGQIVRWMRSGP